MLPAVHRLRFDPDARLRWLATGMWLAISLTLLVSTVIWASRGAPWQTLELRMGPLSLAAIVLTGAVYSSVGASVVRHVPRNPIGWLFLAVALGMAVLLPVNLVLESTVQAFRPVPSVQLWMAWALSSVQLPFSGAAVIVTVLLFPHGRPVWRHSHTTTRLAIGGAILLAVSATFRPAGLLWYRTLPNPAAAPADLKSLLAIVSLVGLAALIVALVAAAASLLWRFRLGDPRERRPLAWVLGGSAVMAGAVAVLFAARYSGTIGAEGGDLLLLVGAIGAAVLPLSMVRFRTMTEARGQQVADHTFLFTDLQDSTAMYERIGDVTAFELVRLHFDTLESATRHHGGAIVKTIGDAIMARFSEPDEAVRTALEMFERLERFNLRSDTRLILKVGLHRGPAIAVTSKGRDDYFGQSVNIAARVGAIAIAGELVLTESVYESAGVASLLEGRATRQELVTLKGVASAVSVYRVAGVGPEPARRWSPS